MSNLPITLQMSSPAEHSEPHSSDDEAPPEAVTFQDSRAAALEVFKAAASAKKGMTAKQRKSREEKRRKRQTEEEDNKETKSRLESLKEQAEKGLFEEEEDTEEKEEEPKEEEPANKIKKFDEDLESETDFIPLDHRSEAGKTVRHGTTEFHVRKLASKRLNAAAAIVNYKRDLLYGKGSNIRREPSQTSVARKQKLEATGKNVYCK